MTYLLIRQRCCLCGDRVGTTQLLQLWCHHAAALLVSVERRFLPGASCSQNSEAQATGRAHNITTENPEVRLPQRFKHMPRKLAGKFVTAEAVMHVRRSSHVKGLKLQVRYPRLNLSSPVFSWAGAISQSLYTKSGVKYAKYA